MHPAVVVAAGAPALVLGVLVSVGAVIAIGATGLQAGAVAQAAPSAQASASIPAAMLGLYQAATAAACPAMPWQVLAAIGTVESDNGTSDLPGVTSGANPAGAEGVMQFEPQTFDEYALPVPPGGANPPSPYDPTDAVWAAARMHCANGADSGDVRGAIYAYNHSLAYVEAVWDLAVAYGMSGDGTPGSASAAAPPPGPTYHGDVFRIIAAAESQLGVAYQLGAYDPGVALDCSALVAYAFAQDGISLPRTTFGQVETGITVPTSALAPGDLLFFYGGDPPAAFGHVGIYLGNGLMIEAPHTGAVVSITAVDLTGIELARRVIQ